MMSGRAKGEAVHTEGFGSELKVGRHGQRRVYFRMPEEVQTVQP